MKWIKFGDFRIINYPKQTIINKTKFLLELTSSYIFEYKNRNYCANVGEITDGASIPDVFKKLVGNNYQYNYANLLSFVNKINAKGSYVPAAFIHDSLCHRALAGNPVCSWPDAHKIFYHAMLANGCKKWGIKGAWIKYQAVKFGMFFRRWKYKKN